MTGPTGDRDDREVVTVFIDCHDHAYHEVDPEYPECGPGNLPRIAEEYGILIEYLPDHDWAGWAWWYKLTGPRGHIVRFLVDEYCGDEGQAREMVDGEEE